MNYTEVASIEPVGQTTAQVLTALLCAIVFGVAGGYVIAQMLR